MRGPKPRALPLGDTPSSNGIIQKIIKSCQENLNNILNFIKNIENLYYNFSNLKLENLYNSNLSCFKLDLNACYSWNSF
jgi:hypothetical protein